MMVSNHYPMITDHPSSWLLAGLIIIGGALLRHFLVRTEVGDAQTQIAWTIPLAAAALAAALFITEPAHVSAYQGEVTDAEALSILQTRCSACHAAKPTDKMVKSPPKGVKLEALADLERYAKQIQKQAVDSKAMPLGNKTGMLPEERAKLGAWIAKR